MPIPDPHLKSVGTFWEGRITGLKPVQYKESNFIDCSILGAGGGGGGSSDRDKTLKSFEVGRFCGRQKGYVTCSRKSVKLRDRSEFGDENKTTLRTKIQYFTSLNKTKVKKELYKELYIKMEYFTLINKTKVKKITHKKNMFHVINQNESDA